MLNKGLMTSLRSPRSTTSSREWRPMRARRRVSCANFAPGAPIRRPDPRSGGTIAAFARAGKPDRLPDPALALVHITDPAAVAVSGTDRPSERTRHRRSLRRGTASSATSAASSGERAPVRGRRRRRGARGGAQDVAGRGARVGNVTPRGPPRRARPHGRRSSSARCPARSPPHTAAPAGRRSCACMGSPTPGAPGSSCSRASSAITTSSPPRWPATPAARRWSTRRATPRSPTPSRPRWTPPASRPRTSSAFLAEPTRGLEPRTPSLRVKCSTS